MVLGFGFGGSFGAELASSGGHIRCGSDRACIVAVAKRDCRAHHDAWHCRIWRRHRAPIAHVADVACGTVACDQAYLVELVGPAEAACAEGVIAREDPSYDPEQWNTAGSGAYGIPQSLPASDMAAAGPDYMTDPDTQLRWMVTIDMGSGPDAHYSDACAALAHENAYGWY